MIRNAIDRLAGLEVALREIDAVLSDDNDWDLSSNFRRVMEIVHAALGDALTGVMPHIGVDDSGDTNSAKGIARTALDTKEERS